MAWHLFNAGRRREAALLLLQWKLGLRPTEAIELRGSDLYPESRSAGSARVGFVKLGSLRGTKSGRPQIARTWPWDRIACFILEAFARTTPATARLTSTCDYRHYHLLWKWAASRALLPPSVTPHAARAGWASAPHGAGQPFADLREDGRWRTDASLRVYLDLVAASDLLTDPLHANKLAMLRHLDLTLTQWLQIGV